MSEAFHNDPCCNVEAAVKAYLDANAYTVNTSLANYKGSDSPSLTTPRVVAIASNAASEMQDGTWDLELNIEVISNGNDLDGQAHHLIASEVFARFMTATIAAELSAAIADFTIQRVIPDGQEKGRRGDDYVSTIKFKLKGVVGQSGV